METTPSISVVTSENSHVDANSLADLTWTGLPRFCLEGSSQMLAIILAVRRNQLVVFVENIQDMFNGTLPTIETMHGIDAAPFKLHDLIE